MMSVVSRLVLINQAAIMTGSRFTIYQQKYAQLERALINFMLLHMYRMV